jgi:predicted CXXCH cytochrome family protein
MWAHSLRAPCFPEGLPSREERLVTRGTAQKASFAAILVFAALVGLRPTGPDPVTTPQPDRPDAPEVYSHPTGEDAPEFTCGRCHIGDGAIVPRIVVADVDQVCADCHTEESELLASDVHADLTCTDCHVLHESPDPGLLTEVNPDLCLECHPASLYDAHPTRPEYWDFHAEEPLTCTSTCHDPHGATHPMMLRVPYGEAGTGEDFICLLCHTEVGIEY